MRDQIQQIVQNHIAAKGKNVLQRSVDGIITFPQKAFSEILFRGSFAAYKYGGRKLPGHGQVTKYRVTQHKPVQQRNSVHTKQIGKYQFPAQERQHKAAEIDRTDIVAEGQEIFRFPLCNHLPHVQIIHHPCSHGETAEKSHQHGIAYIFPYF